MRLIAGVDEVGRGCLFGSVVAAAVVISPDQELLLVELGVTDSKKLSAAKREILVPKIEAIVTDWAIASASAAEVDEINILQASLLAMRRAVAQLKIKPDHVLVDGRQTIPQIAFSQEAVVQGDLKFKAIAAASILAKVYRDHQIIKLAATYPEYDLANNKGYGTEKHRHALLKYGLTPEHRQSFRISE